MPKARRTWWNKTKIKHWNCFSLISIFFNRAKLFQCFSFRDVRTSEIKLQLNNAAGGRLYFTRPHIPETEIKQNCRRSAETKPQPSAVLFFLQCATGFTVILTVTVPWPSELFSTQQVIAGITFVHIRCFYRATLCSTARLCYGKSSRPSVCLSVTLVCPDHIVLNFLKKNTTKLADVKVFRYRVTKKHRSAPRGLCRNSKWNTGGGR